jgi:hypothetical protein
MDKAGLRQEFREAKKTVCFFLPIDVDNETENCVTFQVK